MTSHRAKRFAAWTIVAAAFFTTGWQAGTRFSSDALEWREKAYEWMGYADNCARTLIYVRELQDGIAPRLAYIDALQRQIARKHEVAARRHEAAVAAACN